MYFLSPFLGFGLDPFVSSANIDSALLRPEVAVGTPTGWRRSDPAVFSGEAEDRDDK